MTESFRNSLSARLFQPGFFFMHHLETPCLGGRHASDGTPLAYAELVAVETRDELPSAREVSGQCSSQQRAEYAGGHKAMLSVVLRCRQISASDHPLRVRVGSEPGVDFQWV